MLVLGLSRDLVLLGICAVALLVVLAFWQRLIDRHRSRRVIREIRDADSRGTARAIAQHPQIRPDLCIGCSSCIRACPEAGVIGLVDGVARIIHGSRCIGHGRCEDACPVGAIRVGLGDLAARPDIPQLSSGLETTVPGVYIAGELGGFALIRNAVDQGVRAVEDIARTIGERRDRPRDGVLDLLIVGAGPSGIAASLKATEANLSYLTISQDDLGGAVRHYPRRKLTMTQPMTLPLHGRLRKREYLKEELIDLWEELRREYGLKIETGRRLQSVRRAEGSLHSQTGQAMIQSRFVLLALGRRGTPRRLEVPGEDSEKVFYRLIDAATYRNEKLLVVGGGDSAIEAATALANQAGNAVTLSYRKSSFFRLKPRNEERIREYAASSRVNVLFSSTVVEIRPKSVVLSMAEDGDRQSGETAQTGPRLVEIDNDFVFIFAGGVAPFSLLKEIGIRFGGEESARDRAGERRIEELAT